ncbi:EAL domain-containing protein [Spirulina sp. CCNP1310]|uniref:putative bifunctional diguanylate cyclase/phosphodiesterase n=1 Tax=Spirulina sp. CCNP1310 TaxID=3110249 RepID=UPI002B1FF440|nr:EAL domain-containing protein [Spirulina sp. CCNP1310]MEA5420715.1 EAL domain-containing protein [Spirulina sp. CCNP1310]
MLRMNESHCVELNLELACLEQVRSPLLLFDAVQGRVFWANRAARLLWEIPLQANLQRPRWQERFPLALWRQIYHQTQGHPVTAALRLIPQDPASTLQCAYVRLERQAVAAVGKAMGNRFPLAPLLIEVQQHLPPLTSSATASRGQQSTGFDPASPSALNAMTSHPDQHLRRYQHILGMIATAQPLPKILEQLLWMVEQQVAGVRGVILLLDGRQSHWEQGVAVSLPPDYWAIAGMDAHTPLAHSSLLASITTRHNQPILALNLPDTEALPHEQQVARHYGLHHGWGIPLRSSQGDSLGAWVSYADSTEALTAAQGVITNWALCLAEIALDHARSHQAIQQAEAKYHSIFENIGIGIFQTTPDGHYLHANPALATIYGYNSPAELIRVLTNIGDQLYVDPHRRQQFTELLHTNGRVSNFESQVYCRDGGVIWISENTRAVRDSNGTLLYYEGTVEDITARRIAEEKLFHSALHDTLTGLPNRACLLNRLQRAITHPPEAGEYALLFLDLDRFKVVNDSLGHLIGDELLKAAAQRIQSQLEGQHTVARLGGDEFAIILAPIAGVEAAIAIAQGILTEFERPFQIRQYEIFTAVSIGIAMGQPSYQQPEDILRDADLAMYQAKRQGVEGYQVFVPQMQTHNWQRLQLENDLRKGLERGEFHLVYQPIVDVKTHHLYGFEALLRWQHPQRGLIAPTEFIPIAEETGLIHPLGWWVIEQACQQLNQWQARDLFVNVNLSLVQLQEAKFVEKLTAICEQTHIQPQQLKLEITESCLLTGTYGVGDRLKQIKALGCGLCIDDFGTGYSSLSRLHEFPVDTLKIDRAFVQEIDSDRLKIALVKTIMTLADSLGMQVVAEGIETQAQCRQLQQLGCTHGQGYYFSPALSRETATIWAKGQFPPFANAS